MDCLLFRKAIGVLLDIIWQRAAFQQLHDEVKVLSLHHDIDQPDDVFMACVLHFAQIA